LPPPRQPQLVDVQRVEDVNPFQLDPTTGQGAGRGAALEGRVPGFRMPSRRNLALPKNPLDMEVTVALPDPPPICPSVPAVTSVPRPWYPRVTPSTHIALATPTFPLQTLPPAGGSVGSPTITAESLVSWGDLVDEAEERGELGEGPMSTLSGDKPIAEAPPMADESVFEDPPSSPRSPDRDDAAQDDLTSAPTAAVVPIGTVSADLDI